ncbi:MAG: NlpC/P60 family protein [Bacteroidaceae bacterium]|jgi:SH3-like domain-containing protein
MQPLRSFLGAVAGFLLLGSAISSPLQAQTTLAAPGDTLCDLRGVVNVSVCNLHARADFESPMETQALLGMPVRIHHKARWYQIETIDGYQAWAHRAVVVPMDSTDFARWEAAPKLICTATYAQIYATPEPDALPMGDLVSGCILELRGKEGRFYQAAYPDGREGYVLQSQVLPLNQWLAQCEPTLPRFIHTAQTLTGIPYLWAGTSAKGLDCSGLVQLAAQLNGAVLPRNASQQARCGTRIPCFRTSDGRMLSSLASADSLRRYPVLTDATSAKSLMDALAAPARFFGVSIDLSQLQPGDLVLFGKPHCNGKERVSHIGIYLGQGRFIHSQGFVHTSSLIPGQPGYDAMNHSRFLGATRTADAQGRLQAPLLEQFIR